MSTPGLWKKIPGYLLDPMGPFTLRLSSLPALLPWLWRFLQAGRRWEQVRATSAVLHRLLHDAPARHRELAGWAGAEHLLHHNGLLYAYPHRQAFEQEAMAWQLRREQGLIWQELEGDALRSKTPALDATYELGIWLPAGSWCSDPGGYVARLVSAAQQQGAQLERTRVERLRVQEGRCQGVETSQGPLSFDRTVISAGLGSAAFARQAGDSLPLAGERGYHVVLPNAALNLDLPIMPSDGRMANTPMASGLRLAGQVELTCESAEPNWARAHVLLAHAQRSYPALASTERCADMSTWMGHRPSTPDGLPVIGPSPRCQGLWYACGHGHVGLAASARTADLVAEGLRTHGGGRPLQGWQALGVERFDRGVFSA
jgi:D-amino-acid dehydrogenase